VPQDKMRAENWWELAAVQEHVETQFRLGTHLLEGRSYSGDLSPFASNREPSLIAKRVARMKGMDWLQRAAEQGHEGAIVLLKEIEEQELLP